jgi:hypothetical protein
MTFDLVLTARDRKSETLRFFDSLASQKGAGQVRVLFADQGLNINAEAHAILSKRSDVSLLTQEIPHSALSVARNKAINFGLQSEFIGFPDDDCWYSPDVLQAIKKIFEEQPNIQCICTNVFDPHRNLSYGGRPVGVRKAVSFSNIFSLPISVGIFVRRKTFEAVGARFDEKLGAGTPLGSGEETELIGRLLDYGANILYAGDISVFHPAPIYGKDDAIKFYKYGVGYGYLSSRFIKRGHFIVARSLTDLVVRSSLGLIIFIFNKNKRDVYAGRLLGILKGCLQVFLIKEDIKS